MVSSSSANELNTDYEEKMPLERTELLIKEGQEEAFAAAMRTQGVPLLSGVPGVLSVSFGRERRPVFDRTSRIRRYERATPAIGEKA